MNCILAALLSVASSVSASSAGGGTAALSMLGDQCARGVLDPGGACASVKAEHSLAALEGDCSSLRLPEICASMAGSPPPACNGKSDKCVDRLAELIWAVVRGTPADVGRVRAEMVAVRGKQVGRKIDAFAHAIRKGLGAQDFCRQQAANWSDRRSCADEAAVLDGESARCRGHDVQLCREDAALLAALRAPDFARACSKSPFCAALKDQDVHACRPLETAWVEGFCRDVRAAASKPAAAANGPSRKRRFKTGQPMQDLPPDVAKKMRAIEKGQAPSAQNKHKEDAQ